MADDQAPALSSSPLPRMHSYPPEKFPITLRIRSGTTGKVVWSRTVTIDEARAGARIEIPSYRDTEHYPVSAEIFCADGTSE